jgi:hypothetical protein
MQKVSEHSHVFTITLEEVVKKLIDDTCVAEPYHKATMRCNGNLLILELFHKVKEDK